MCKIVKKRDLSHTAGHNMRELVDKKLRKEEDRSETRQSRELGPEEDFVRFECLVVRCF